MKKHLLGAIALLALCTGASAETFHFPSEAPVATATYPDSWKAEETDKGLQGFSADNEVALYVELSSAKDINANIDEAVKFLADNGVTVDKSTLTEADTEINGMPASGINIDGTDENGPVGIGLYFIGLSAETTVMVTNWTSKNEDGSIDEALRQQIIGVIDSIKPAAQ